MVICGGYDGTRQLNDVWNFNFQSSKKMGWTKLETLGSVYGLFKHSAIMYKNFMIIYGGYFDNGKSVSASIFIFNTLKYEWTKVLRNSTSLFSNNIGGAQITNSSSSDL